jgi:hypothetical protein
MTIVDRKFKIGDRVICTKDSPDLIWYGENCENAAGNAICIAPLLYHVDNVLWTEKLGWILSISGELHSATDFVHEVDVVGEGNELKALVADQQLEIKELKLKLKQFESDKQCIVNMLVSIGGGLNDNVLEYTPAQRKELYKIYNLAENGLEMCEC